MHTTQREEEEGDNDRFNAVSHKHALIRAEGWHTNQDRERKRQRLVER